MKELQKWIEPVLKEHGCRLYEIQWLTNQKPPILQIAAEKEDGTMDLDTCAVCSDAISALLDEKDWNDQEYMLEVCSPGAERELKTEQDLQNALGQYVYVKLREPKQGLADVRGDLAALEPESVTVHYKDKGRPKKLVVDRDNTSLIMTAVKI